MMCCLIGTKKSVPNSAQASLHSLLEALPAASVDTGIIDVGTGNASSNANNNNNNNSILADRRTSLSTTSLDSRCSDLDSYFYI